MEYVYDKCNQFCEFVTVKNIYCFRFPIQTSMGIRLIIES